MKLRNTLLILILSVGFFSCIKSNNIVDDGSIIGGGGTGGGGGGGGTTGPVGNLLVRHVSTEGSDSVVTKYTYDGSSRLIKEDIKGRSGGFDIDIVNNYTRNASGIITQVQQISLSFLGGYDTAYTNYHYDAGLGRYAYSVMTNELMGLDYYDSTIFTYNGSGKLISDLSYAGNSIMGIEESTRSTYTLNGNGDLTNMVTEDKSSGIWEEVATYVFTYDSKTNPMATLSANDYIVTGFSNGSYNHNITKIAISSTATPSANRTITNTYNYSTNDKPVSGTSVQAPGGTSQLKFYYQ